MRLRDDFNLYVDVLEGSYIVVEGACLPVDELESLDWPQYHVIIVYDKLGAFASDEESAEIRKDKAEQFLVALKRDPCSTIGCPAALLLLKWTDASYTTARLMGVHAVETSAKL